MSTSKTEIIRTETTRRFVTFTKEEITHMLIRAAGLPDDSKVEFHVDTFDETLDDRGATVSHAEHTENLETY